jgi:hypothetical protein
MINGTCRPMRITRSTLTPISAYCSSTTPLSKKHGPKQRIRISISPPGIRASGMTYVKKNCCHPSCQRQISRRGTVSEINPEEVYYSRLSDREYFWDCWALHVGAFVALIPQTGCSTETWLRISTPRAQRKFIHTQACFPGKLNCNFLHHLRTLRLTEPRRTQFGRIILASHGDCCISMAFAQRHLTHRDQPTKNTILYNLRGRYVPSPLFRSGSTLQSA